MSARGVPAGLVSRRDSIARRLAFTIAGITIVAVLAACGLLIGFQVAAFRREMVRQATVLADLVGAQSITALAFGDEEEATEILAALSVDEHVLRACLYGQDEQSFARFVRRGAAVSPSSQCPHFEADGVRFGLRRMSYYRAILVDGERVATLFLESDASALLGEVSRSAFSLLAILVASSALGVAISRQLRRTVWTPVEQLILHSRAVADGDLTRHIETGGRGELGALAAAFAEMSARLRGLADQVRTNAVAVTSAIGELRDASEATVHDARAQADGVMRSSESLQGIGQSVKQINAGIETLSGDAERKLQIVRETGLALEGLAKSTERLSGSVEGNAASISELTASIGEIAESARALKGAADESGRTVASFSRASQRNREIAAEGHRLSTASLDAAREAFEAVSQTIEGMAEVRARFDEIQNAVAGLSDQLESIRGFVGLIEGIADATQLLALNARIIAAQAGEHGRAFGVVAQEVATLADQTATSASEIAGKVGSVGQAAADVVGAVNRGSERVSAGVVQSNQAGRVLERIFDQSQRLQGVVGEIHQTSEGQDAAVNEILGALGEALRRVGEIEHALGEQAHSTQGIATTAQGLTDLAEEVRGAMRLQRSRGEAMTTSVQDMRAQIAEILAATRVQAARGDEIDGALRDFQQGSEASIERASALLAIVENLSERSEQLAREVQRFRT